MRQNSGRETRGITPRILFEDSNLLGLDKPAHLVVLPTSHYPKLETTLAGFVFDRLGAPIKNIGKDCRFGFVHRLDRDTSGVIVVAKNQKLWDFLTKQFEEHKVLKTYQALVWGDFWGEKILNLFDYSNNRKSFFSSLKIEDNWLVVSSRLNRNPLNTQKFIVSLVGGEAITKIRPIRKYRLEIDNQRSEIVTLLEIQPLTGRTHQIRVHLSALGYPVVGDWLYGGRKKFRWTKAKGLGRQFLHSQKIVLSIPDGKPMSFGAPLADDLRKFLTKLLPLRT